MAKGTDSGLLTNPKAQSVFKHGILNHYILPFAVMTAAKLDSPRAILVDGFAGCGRYNDGAPASAELLLRAAQKANINVEVFLTEQNDKNYQKLKHVASEYVECGVNVNTFKGKIQDRIDAITSLATGAPLFLFLDPCGANLPFDTLVTTLGGTRGMPWPRTEALLNVSADLTRRAAGAVRNGHQDNDAIPVMNAVCGGTWWKHTALEARDSSGSDNWEAAAEAVVAEYSRRLGQATGMETVIAPVRRKAHHQPIYHLVFLTRANHGLWLFGDAVATARRDWLRFLGPDGDNNDLTLFDIVDDQFQKEDYDAIQIAKANILQLASRGSKIKLVECTREVFGDLYGFAQEKIIRRAMREVEQDDEVPVNSAPKQVRDWKIG